MTNELVLWLKPYYVRDIHGCYLRRGTWKGATVSWDHDESSSGRETCAFSSPFEAEEFVRKIFSDYLKAFPDLDAMVKILRR